jgi:signal transduction histidine kinase
MILDMYLDKIPDKDMKEMLTDIDGASVRLINIVNDFLEVSRLEQGKVETRKEAFDLSVLITKVIKDLKGMADNKNISLSYNMPVVALPNALGDSGHTEQILINLIGNVIKFTESGSVVITTEADKSFLNIRVTDTGMGIEMKNQSLLFRKFQQAGSQVLARKDSNSTGLGLYISKLLVSSMGGNIKLEKSGTGAGSTFAFTIPFVV